MKLPDLTHDTAERISKVLESGEDHVDFVLYAIVLELARREKHPVEFKRENKARLQLLPRSP